MRENYFEQICGDKECDNLGVGSSHGKVAM